MEYISITSGIWKYIQWVITGYANKRSSILIEAVDAEGRGSPVAPHPNMRVQAHKRNKKLHRIKHNDDRQKLHQNKTNIRNLNPNTALSP